MRYSTAVAFRIALEHRLQTVANEMPVPLIRLRKLVVFDRLMARLLVIAPGRWILPISILQKFPHCPWSNTSLKRFMLTRGGMLWETKVVV